MRLFNFVDSYGYVTSGFNCYTRVGRQAYRLFGISVIYWASKVSNSGNLGDMWLRKFYTTTMTIYPTLCSFYKSITDLEYGM